MTPRYPFTATITDGKPQVGTGPVYPAVCAVVNKDASDIFLEFHRKLPADVTPGSSVPDWWIPVPAGGSAVMDALPQYQEGLTICARTLPGGGTAPTGNVYVSMVF